MNINKDVIHDLYNTLLKLRYPEVAQTSIDEFESNILTGTKRLDFLSWVLQEGSSKNTELLSKFKDNSLSNKLVKCFTHIGLCTDENIILGKCDINKQIHFLSLLTLFINNVHLPDSPSPTNHLNANSISEVIVNEGTTLSNLPINVTCRNNIDASWNEDRFSELTKNTNVKLCSDLSFIDVLCLNIKKKVNDLDCDKDLKNWIPVLQEFNSAFKDIMTTPIPDSNCNAFSHYKEFSTDIQKAYSLFSTFKKTLVIESQIKNGLLIDKSVKSNKCISEVLQNSLVLIEQAYNALNDKIC
ncbi:uncharacterized protein LOC106641143 [Copidosoma floridanum]|uniref:uncharacterized protein LOC106641143 n=1 Tax=Copidosoma floridanum TaxID=29053 RepID=UPI0006C9480A|nr:uncharacterized protein LOC106641143 [Copidosoma floridanum]